MDAGPFVEGNGEVGRGRRERRRREREKRERRRERGGVELKDDDDDHASTSSSSSSSSSPPSFSFPPLRFRASGKGECAASECSLLCNDLLRRGARGLELEAAEEEEVASSSNSASSSSSSSSPSSSLLRAAAGAAPARMLVDPGVRVAYTLADAAHLRARDRVRGIAASSWREVAASPAIDWGDNSRASSSSSSLSSSSSTSPVPPSSSSSLGPLLADPAWEACCLKPGADAIVWAEDCGWDSWRDPSESSSAKSTGELSLGAGAARRRREAGFAVDERVTVVGVERGEDEDEEALLPPPR